MTWFNFLKKNKKPEEFPNIEWVNARSQLPYKFKTVFIRLEWQNKEKIEILPAKYCPNHGWEILIAGYSWMSQKDFKKYITHWLPMPEAPN